jgi:hypothetical protein
MPQPTGGPDWDNDGFEDAADNCTLVSNLDQTDADADGYGNACDGDFDGDGVAGTQDFLLLRRSFGESSGSPNFLAGADLDANGVIGGSDFSGWLRRFGSEPGPSGLGCAGTPPCP